MKWIVIVALALIVASLVSAGVFLVRDRGKTRNVVRALSVRVGISVALFVFILVAHQLGWIESSGLPIGRGGP